MKLLHKELQSDVRKHHREQEMGKELPQGRGGLGVHGNAQPSRADMHLDAGVEAGSE